MKFRHPLGMAVVLGFGLITLAVAAEQSTPVKNLPLPGEVFAVEGRTAFLIAPKSPDHNTSAMPWVWYAPTLPNLPGVEEKWMFERFLDAGIAVAGIDVGESYGSPEGRQLFTAFYGEMTKNRKMAAKPCLLARSRGGLMLLNWAAEHPEAVGGFAGVYPVSNLRDYPGLETAAPAYELSAAELERQLPKHNPIERLAPLAKAGVPFFIIHGDSDATVPLATNSAEIQRRYKALGGTIELVIPKGQGHNMWPGFFQCQALVDFVTKKGNSGDLASQFRNPPDAARPWVYWMFMDGHLTREGMTADLEAMNQAGIGGAIFMEVDDGIPRGPVNFMSKPWRKLLQHAAAEADRLGLQLALAAGPGWCGTGGPWIKPDQSMQHLVASKTTASGPARFNAVLPRPLPRTPFFGEGTLTPELHKIWKEFYRDVVVLAFETPQGNAKITDIDEKALYYRAPYSSQPGVKPFLPAPADHPTVPTEQCVSKNRIVDLTDKLDADGRLVWDVPAGSWTILRFGRTITGQTTRPAPLPGLGLESDKFDKAGIDAQFDGFIDPLMKIIGPTTKPDRGLTTLHFDSWEMSSQNWSPHFREEFQKRRGYDLLKFLPTMLGYVVENNELSERFLWDLRQTAQELVVENHAMYLKERGRRFGLNLSIEPYDLNPCADLTLGGAADVPMCEFWAQGHTFDTTFSCIEAASVAHTLGRPIVGAESFTSGPEEAWRLYPGAMKAQADWALCAGINRITFHRYQHQPWLDRRPGMTMGGHGVHWERTQTWWDMVPAFHAYLSRCQTMLRRGLPVADILYLNPEGAPMVFRAPASALRGNPPDRRGYNFDAIAPEALTERISVKEGRLVLPEGTSYRVLVLPEFDTMSPALLGKIKSLVEAGATVVGSPPRKSPSLVNYPKCDEEVKRLADELWGKDAPNAKAGEHLYGKGRVITDVRLKEKQVELSLDQAKWIWGAEKNAAVNAPAGKYCFRRAFRIEAGRKIKAAKIVMTADNSFELWVNGQSVLSGDNFGLSYAADVTTLLKPGTNLLAVAAENGGEAPNPAGLVGAMSIQFTDGTVLQITTDDKWKTAKTVTKDWTSTVELTEGWTPAKEIGEMGIGPWGRIALPGKASGPYPSYEFVANVLAKMSVPPDFDADKPLRYIHRRDGAAEIYFVANGLPETVETNCTFRVSGKTPELWDAVTGEMRPATVFSQENGRTTVPLSFDPNGSIFVVFREPSQTARAEGRNFPTFEPVTEIAGPWTVEFDPKWGGPKQPVTFETLVDWTKRPEDGIRHYSGKAVYRKTFELSEMSNAGRTYLKLGRIQGMAEVRLNGRPLGVVWCDPWRIEITDAVRQGKNELEVTVVNLWPNRLIGDAAQPQDKRATWTTWSPYRPNSPLFESGLIGPVRIERSVSEQGK